MVCASRFSGLWVWSRTSDVEVNYRALFPYVRIDSSEHYSVLLSNHILIEGYRTLLTPEHYVLVRSGLPSFVRAQRSIHQNSCIPNEASPMIIIE
jgi:hypothetical protein